MLRRLIEKESGTRKTKYGNFVAESDPTSRAAMFTENGVDHPFGDEELELLDRCESALGKERLICIDRTVGNKDSTTTVRLIVPERFAHVATGGKNLFIPAKGEVKEPTYQIVFFADEAFDIIWAEGSIRVIGFERGLMDWRRFLKPNGFLVIHDDTENIRKKLKQVSGHGYELLRYFSLPEDAWWIEYYAPLEKRIKELRTECDDDARSMAALDRDQQFIDLFKKDPSQYGSGFFIMKKV